MSALPKAASAPKSVETLDKCDGHCRAEQCRMRSVSDNDALNQVERLVAELRAIERWDADHWRKCDPEAYEMVAFVARRTRRTEILSQLVTLIPRLVKMQVCHTGQHPGESLASVVDVVSP